MSEISSAQSRVDSLDQIKNTEVLYDKKAQADAIFNARLKSLSQPATPEYDALTPEKLAAYRELGQMTADFKKESFFE